MESILRLSPVKKFFSFMRDIICMLIADANIDFACLL